MVRKGNAVTEGSIIKALLIVAIPIVISNILQSVLEVVDMYFIGQLGEDAIAGGTMSISIIMFLTTVLFGIGVACAALTSHAYGSERYERISVILAHALYLSLIVSAAIAVIGFFWSEDLLLLLGADPGVLTEGSKFLRPTLVGLFVMIMLSVLVIAFQSSGDSRTPMYAMVAVNIFNIVLNPTLIQGMAGLPAFGIAGSAYASIISRSIGIILLLAVIYLHPAFRNTPVRLPKKWTFEPQLIKEIVCIAVPSAIQGGVRSFGFLMMTSIITIFYGMAAVAAYGISIRLDMLGFIVAMGLCAAITVMVGQNLGAGKVERAELSIKYAVILNAIFMACIAISYYSHAGDLLAFFGAEGGALNDSILFMHIIPPFSYVIIAVAMTLGFAMNGAGVTRPGMYSAIAGQIFTQVVLAAFFAHLGYPIEYIWYAIVYGSVVTFFCDLFFYHKGDWKRKQLDIG